MATHLPQAREEYRVITVFDDFEHWEYHLHKTVVLKDQTDISLTCSTVEQASALAASLRRLHSDEAVALNPNTPTIKSQTIQGRIITDWEKVS